MHRETSAITLPQMTAGLAESARQERLRCAREIQRVINALPFADVHAMVSIPEVKRILQTLQSAVLQK